MITNSLLDFIKSAGYTIEVVKEDERIKFIKSFDKPPWDEKDIYWQRYPWQKFGSVSSGICMVWCWYRDDVILKKCTDEDIDEAYSQMKAYYEHEQFHTVDN